MSRKEAPNMRVAVKIYRTVKVPTAHLKQSVGLETEAPNDKADLAVKETFGPHMAPGLKIFWPEPAGFKTTVVGMEALGFDVPVPTQTPQATDALTMCDPINDRDTHRIDGSLRGELMRMGLWTEAKDYEWRVATNLKS